MQVFLAASAHSLYIQFAANLVWEGLLHKGQAAAFGLIVSAYIFLAVAMISLPLIVWAYMHSPNKA